MWWIEAPLLAAASEMDTNERDQQAEERVPCHAHGQSSGFNHFVRCAGAGGWCWSGVREKYCWLAGGWRLVLELCERKILLADWRNQTANRVNLKKWFLAIHGQASGFSLHSLEDNNSTSYQPIVVKARVSEWDESLSSTADYGGGWYRNDDGLIIEIKGLLQHLQQSLNPQSNYHIRRADKKIVPQQSFKIFLFCKKLLGQPNNSLQFSLNKGESCDSPNKVVGLGGGFWDSQ